MNSRFRPAEILESIVQPSKVVSDQYRSITVATQDGKLYNGMPIVTDPMNLVLLLSDGTKTTLPRSEIEEQKASATLGDARGPLEPPELPGDRRPAGPFELHAPSRRARVHGSQREVVAFPMSLATVWLWSWLSFPSGPEASTTRPWSTP